MASTPERREQIGAFFAAHAHRLQHTVRRAARAPEPTIEDACATAWTKLLARPDVSLDARGLAWLTTVAIHEAWRLTCVDHEAPVGSFQGPPTTYQDDQPEPADPYAPGTDERALQHIEHAQRLVALRALKPREREALYLQGLGYSYQEIATLTNSTYTAVNRRLTEGRARLRDLVREHEHRQQPDDRSDGQP